MKGLHISIHPDSETVVVIREMTNGYEVAALWFDTVYEIIGTTRKTIAFALPEYSSPDGIGLEYDDVEEIKLSDPNFELTPAEATAICNFLEKNSLFKEP